MATLQLTLVSLKKSLKYAVAQPQLRTSPALYDTFRSDSKS